MQRNLLMLGALVGCAADQSMPAEPSTSATRSPSAATTAVWDDAAAGEVRAVTEKMIVAFGQGDMATVKSLIARDAASTSLDYDLENKPIVLPPGELDAYFDRTNAMIAEMKKAGGTFEQKVTSWDCKATATLGWCFLGMQGQGTMPGGGAFKQTGWGTAVLRKGQPGWQFSHWHATMAPPAAPPAPTLAAAGMNAGDYKWTTVVAGIKTANLWDNAGAQVHVAVHELPKNLKFPMHMHGANFWIYVAKGQLTHTAKGGTPRVTKAGGFEFTPARELHTTESGPKGATLYLVTDGPFDLLGEDGKPMPPPPAAPSK